MADVAVYGALHSLKTYGDREPLAKLVESGNQAVLGVLEVRQVLADAVRGKAIVGGTKKTTIQQKRIERAVSEAVGLLVGLGMTFKNDKNTSAKTCACRVVGEIVASDESTVYGYIGDRKKNPHFQIGKITAEVVRGDGGTVDDVLALLAPIAIQGNRWQPLARTSLVGLFPDK